jgi:agmatinase
MSSLLYADAESPLDGATIAIIGAPFESTTCHRKGCGKAPGAIREESYNFETYIPGIEFDIEGLDICDCGDLGGDDFSGFFKSCWKLARDVISEGSFPILIGGEHSVTPLWLASLMAKDPWGSLGDLSSDSGPVATGLQTETPPGNAGPVRRITNPFHEGICVVMIDAHMDFRDGYLDEPLSHASASRRTADLVGAASVIPFGVRSYCLEEKEDAARLGLSFVTADDVRTKGAVKALQDGLAGVPPGNREKIYLSLDMDGIDPAYAPGIGTPEPFGLTPLDVREIIRSIGPRLIGFDVVEVCPAADNGNTAALACRLISEVMAMVGKKKV